ncbi:hypothetical protein CEXT_362241 [Caerostris extrusa]|uniref:Uncharacterized protein n=1 Tax=Caerostris extrusa TaxID=172846 RepID=A0AAV4MV90_CAEEX|nr:hypothetical protein CEXT_362241 [Caerostris extrusa]
MIFLVCNQTVIQESGRFGTLIDFRIRDFVPSSSSPVTIPPLVHSSSPENSTLYPSGPEIEPLHSCRSHPKCGLGYQALLLESSDNFFLNPVDKIAQLQFYANIANRVKCFPPSVSSECNEKAFHPQIYRAHLRQG